jgi:hypothetical protein
VISFEIHRQRSILTIIVLFAYWDVHVFDMVRKNFRCIIAASILYFKIAASSLSYRALLESLDKSPEMNVVLSAIVLLLSPRSKDLMLLLIIIVFQPLFVLFGGIF